MTSQRLWVDDHDSLPSPEELEALRDLGRRLDIDVGSLFRYLDRSDETIPKEYLAWTDAESATRPSSGHPALFRRRRPPHPEPISARNRTDLGEGGGGERATGKEAGRRAARASSAYRPRKRATASPPGSAHSMR